MDILYNNKLINDIVEKLFKHRRSDYSEYNLGIIIYYFRHPVKQSLNQS